ncbi:MAG: ABC transporter ATP-binding protein [Synergistaceae bacterium]|jgi:sulfonate transport system ATP-binding protein|nr:ABC transporter ATP-binding protein [Synergistaceae bacterium]
MGNSLKLENLSKNFVLRDRVVNALADVNFEILENEFVCIVGASGCGKSTLLRLIIGLEKDYEGSIQIGGVPIEKAENEVGMVFQESRLFPWLTVEQNVYFGLDERAISKTEKIRVAREQIELVGLSDFERAYPHQLSGGMQQRVSIARALVNNPKYLLLDEPFGALDALTRINMQQEILRIWQEEKTTMILVTHDIDEAIFLGGRIAVMSNRPGTIQKIFNVELPRPRERSDYDFIAIRKKIYREFFQESEKPFSYSI